MKTLESMVIAAAYSSIGLFLITILVFGGREIIKLG